jgi:putative transposase
MRLLLMPRYVRAKLKGGVFFFTVVLADRSSRLLVDEIDHAVWALPEGDTDFSSRWSLIKSSFSRGLAPLPRSASKVRKREKGIWQRRYWEHAIRDDADLERHIDYIHFNPVKHRHVARVADWPHSSFHRHVERGLLAADWGGDMKEIQGAFGE